MKKLWKGALALTLFGVASAPMASGCVQAEAMFYIQSVKHQECDAESVDSEELYYGRMDIRYSCSYFAVLEVHNQLVRRGNPAKLQLETSRISVTAVDVQLLQADGVTVVREFTYPTSGFVDPATDSQPGRGLAGALLVDDGSALSPGLYVARVVAHGRTLGGDNIETRPFDFDIEVCDGCLCYEPPDDTCTLSMGEAEGDCFMPQDDDFDCRWVNHDCSAPAVCGIF
jgi:hypothetical protein